MWGNPVEIETRRRIFVSVWAYAYEVANDLLVSDEVFDAECRAIDLSIKTTNKKMDRWFKTNFDPSTGMWVHKHPDKAGLKRIYEGMKKRMIPVELQASTLRTLSKTLVDHFEEHSIKIYKEGPRKHLGASIVGEDCARKLWYGFRWVKDVQSKGRMYRLWNRGHKEEARFVEWLRGMGFTVHDIDPVTGKQYRMEDCNGHFGGSCDGQVEFPTNYGELPRMLLEMKTSGTKYFGALGSMGVKDAMPKHFAQMCVYGRKWNLQYALYLCVNKDTDEIYPEVVKLDFEYADKLINRAGDIISQDAPPPRINENSAFFLCKMCDFHDVCHNNVPAMKNCRSCKNAKAVENKQWFCNLYQQVIPEEWVAKGCDAFNGVQ